jgi:hypothetical protein
MRKPSSRRTGSTALPADAVAIGGLDTLAEAVDSLATDAAIKALDAAARIAAADAPSAGMRVARVADDVSARTRRLETAIGRALLARRPG